MLAIELATFSVPAELEEQLVSERPAMIAALKRRFPACQAAFLTKQDDGSWLDVLVWSSRDEALEAAREIDTVPECAQWFRHISESGGLRHVDVHVADWLR
jgi:hypothetical protein